MNKNDRATTGTAVTSALRTNFVNVCLGILYADSKRELFKAYDKFFIDYEYSLMYGDDVCGISLLEDVIIKILNEEDSDLYSKYGMQYTPFDRLVSLVSRQDSLLYSDVENMYRKTLLNHPSRILSRYLYVYLAENTVPLHSTRLKNCIYKNFTELTHAKTNQTD